MLKIKYLVRDRELDNFTYGISNAGELAGFIGEALGVETATAMSYINELSDDRELAVAIEELLVARADRNETMPFGRRLGWYALARILRPRLIVETGLHDGLGASALLRALQRNGEEGHPGEVLSFDVDPSAGWLVPEGLRGSHQIVLGDSLANLPTVLAGRTVDMFIHDSDHRYAHETSEFEIIAKRARPGAVLLSDNAHAGTAFADFCARQGLDFRFWREVPDGHFYPGAGIGMTIFNHLVAKP